MTNLDWDYPNPHMILVTVCAEDIDALSHTNNGVYVNWCEQAAWSHTSALGLTLMLLAIKVGVPTGKCRASSQATLPSKKASMLSKRASSALATAASAAPHASIHSASAACGVSNSAKRCASPHRGVAMRCKGSVFSGRSDNKNDTASTSASHARSTLLVGSGPICNTAVGAS